jgi:O-antigen ligase
MSFSIEKFNKNIFTGREIIWGTIYENLLRDIKSFLFGIGSHFTTDKSIGSNFHNDYLSILLCFGFIGFALFFLFVFRIFNRILVTGSLLSKRVACTYLCLLVIGWFESDCFSWYYGTLSFIFLSMGSMSSINSNTNYVERQVSFEKISKDYD